MGEGSTVPTTRVRPGEKRYPALSRGFNQRWIGRPEYVRLVRTPEEVREALATALRETPADPERTRITVRAGGHCYEDFVCGEDVRVILDVSPMCDVFYDDAMQAYCVQAGATNWHVYRHLYPISGKALPGGSCYSVGLGGHIPAGGVRAAVAAARAHRRLPLRGGGGGGGRGQAPLGPARRVPPRAVHSPGREVVIGLSGTAR